MPEFEKRELASDVPLGEQLRSVRETAKLSLAEVASATKIQQKFLKSLEEGQYEQFPADVYARGFLENYAQFLGFPADEVLTQYKRERGITGTLPKINPLPVNAGTESRFTVTPRTLWLTGGVLSLLIAVGYLVSQLFGLVAAAPKLDVTAPPPNITLTSESIDVEGSTDPGAELTINGQPVPTDPNGGFKEQVRLLPGTNTLRVAAKNKSGKEKVVTRSIVLQALATTPAPTPVPSGMLLTIKVGPNAANIGINVDGKAVFQGLMLPNSEQTFTVASRALVTTSNAGSTQVLINGQDRGTLGREGQRRVGVEFTLPTPAPAPTAAP